MSLRNLAPSLPAPCYSSGVDILIHYAEVKNTIDSFVCNASFVIQYISYTADGYDDVIITGNSHRASLNYFTAQASIGPLTVTILPVGRYNPVVRIEADEYNFSVN
nr:hypothetical protein CFP56_57645 [Quercus suber]